MIRRAVGIRNLLDPGVHVAHAAVQLKHRERPRRRLDLQAADARLAGVHIEIRLRRQVGHIAAVDLQIGVLHVKRGCRQRQSIVEEHTLETHLVVSQALRFDVRRHVVGQKVGTRGFMHTSSNAVTVPVPHTSGILRIHRDVLEQVEIDRHTWIERTQSGGIQLDGGSGTSAFSTPYTPYSPYSDTERL